MARRVKKDVPHVEQNLHTMDRRTMLECSLAGAFAVTMLGGVDAVGGEVKVQPAQQPSGAQQSSATRNRVRRVVTGHNAQGKSYVVSDEMIDGSDLWTTSPSEPLGPASPTEPRTIFPTTRPEVDPVAGGTRCRFLVMQPATQTRAQSRQPPGYHRTATVDYIFIAKGEVVCLLDEGEVKLKAGDTLVQRNTYHAWRNEGTELVHMLAILVRV